MVLPNLLVYSSLLEKYAERVEYIDSFLPWKTKFPVLCSTIRRISLIARIGDILFQISANVRRIPCKKPPLGLLYAKWVY